MSDLCPLCGANPTAVEALRAQLCAAEQELDEAHAQIDTLASARESVAMLIPLGEAIGPVEHDIADYVARLARERDEARAWAKTSAELFEAASLDIAELQRERDARPDPGALLARLDAIRAAAATGARPAELARMVEDVQAGCIRPPTGDGVLLGGERSCFTCRHNVEVGLWGNDCTLLGSGPITTPIDLREAIGAYTNVSGASLADDCMPTNRSIRCPGWAAKEPS